MIARFINGFVSILLGVALIGPISDQVNLAAGPCGMTVSGKVYGTYSGGVCTNGTQTINTTTTSLYATSSWGSTVLQIVPGLFAIAILAIGITVLYGNLKDAGMA